MEQEQHCWAWREVLDKSWFSDGCLFWAWNLCCFPRKGRHHSFYGWALQYQGNAVGEFDITWFPQCKWVDWKDTANWSELIRIEQGEPGKDITVLWMDGRWIKRSVYCLMDALAEAILHAHGCSRKIRFMTARLCKTFQDLKLTYLHRSPVQSISNFWRTKLTKQFRICHLACGPLWTLLRWFSTRTSSKRVKLSLK